MPSQTPRVAESPGHSLGAKSKPPPKQAPKGTAPKTSRPDEKDPAPRAHKRRKAKTKEQNSFLESLRLFFFLPFGVLRILRMVLTIGAVIFFILAEAKESSILFTIMETFIVFVFIIIYMLTLHHLRLTLDWPFLEIISSIVTAVFLLIVFVLALLENKILFYIGGVLSFAAAIVCFVDTFFIILERQKKVKKTLDVKEDEPEDSSTTPVSLDSKEPPGPLGLSRAPSRVSSAPTSMRISQGASRPLPQGASRPLPQDTSRPLSQTSTIKSSKSSRAPSVK